MQGEIVGKPTLLATIPGRQEAQRIVQSIGGTGYPLDDVHVYYRLEGTDQVIDALTGHIASGQSLNAEELGKLDVNKVDTLILMHPTPEQMAAVEKTILTFGAANFKYVDESHGAGPGPDEVEKHPGSEAEDLDDL